MKVKKFVACLSAIAIGALCAFAPACTLTTPGGDNDGGGGEIVTPQDVAVTGVSFTESNVSMKVGESKTLAYSVLPANATNKKVSFESSNAAVAQVADGVVTAKASGTATITVTTDDGGHTAQCNITVTADQTPVEEYTVTFSMGGHGTQVPVQQIASGGKATKPNNPTDANYDFKGWYKENNFKTEFVFSNETITSDVTVYAKWEKKTVAVTEVVISQKTATLEVGGTLVLTASVLPQNATATDISWTSTNTNIVTVSGGTVTAKAAGTATVTAAVGSVKATCSITVNEKQPENPPEVTGELTLSYAHSGNESAAFEWSDTAAKSASVQYKLSSEGVSGYKKADAQLVRQKNSSTARADIVGLKGGETYDFIITSSGGKQTTVSGVSISNYDRSGYAHFNYSGVGAYNNDGTLKSGANVVYVTEETKNTVTAKLGSKTYTGIVAILGGLSNSSVPVVIRVVGTVGAATWNQIDYNKNKEYNSKNKMPDTVVKGKNGKQLPKNSNTYQKDLISDGYNTLNESVYSELKGLDSRLKWDSGKSEYDSMWNNCSIKGAENVTLEGVGEDARIFQWGLTWGSCNSIEVRNLTFEDYTEDACAFEGGSDSTTIDGFNSKHIWLHHNTFEQGVNYWDVCSEQDKHDGDGSTDFKKLAYLTCSYNTYHNCHKTGLVGGSDEVTTASITYHHNYYNECGSRLPLARQANMHMYNNYYYRSTGTNMSLRAGAYALIENCYFDNANNPIEIKTGDGKTGAAKVLGCVFSGKKYASNSYIYEVTDRTKQVKNDNIFNKNFDTDASVFYYDSVNKKSQVSNMLTAEQVKAQMPTLAGVMKRKSNVSTGTGSGGSTIETTISLDKTSASLKVGGSVTLNATVTPAGTATTWKSSDTSVATVAGGVVTANAAGTATITVTAGGVSATCTVTVTAAGGGESQTVVTHSFSYSALAGVSGLANKSALSQANFTGDNAFLTVGSGVTYRTDYECIENKDGGLKVNFEGTGEITITLTSTKNTNVSRIGLKDEHGNYIAASSKDSGFTAVTDAEAGAYEMTGTTKLKITFTVTKAGEYTIVCPSSVTNRGARIFAIEMTDRK